MGQRKNDILLRKIASVVKTLRAKKGVTQQEVFIDINIHVGRIEVVDANPSITTISDLCEYFGIELSDFFKLVENLKEDEI